MQNALKESMSLVDLSGYLIISAILALLICALLTTFMLRLRYASIERELLRGPSADAVFGSKLLNRIVRQTYAASSVHPSDINTQAIIEDGFHTELAWALSAERFVKASTGLLIILGLVGTFYGLTLSIGKLVALISGDVEQATEVTASLTRGLTEALSGMSVAFSTSLFGILAAIVMTLVGVFANVADRRSALMVRIEAFLDNVLLASVRAGLGAQPAQVQPSVVFPSGGGAESPPSLAGFGTSVLQLKEAVGQFEAALLAFSTTTRDFREFNLHLKDNVQRMSLGFGELSDTLKEQVSALKRR